MYFSSDSFLESVGNCQPEKFVESRKNIKVSPHFGVSVPYFHGRYSEGHFEVRAVSGRSSTVSERYRPTTNEKPSETMFQRVLLDFVLKTFGLGAENESLSICSPLCISSNCLCPVLYSQFEGHLGCSKVSFSSPTFAIQTSELQLLTTNLRIIFELTKS